MRRRNTAQRHSDVLPSSWLSFLEEGFGDKMSSLSSCFLTTQKLHVDKEEVLGRSAATDDSEPVNKEDAEAVRMFRIICEYVFCFVLEKKVNIEIEDTRKEETVFR